MHKLNICEIKYAFYLLLIVVLVRTGHCYPRSSVAHTHSVPVDVYSTLTKLVLVSPLSVDECCGQTIKFDNGIGILDVKSCAKVITCKKSPDFRKDIIENPCKTGFPMSGGCAMSDPSYKQSVNHTVQCVCTTKGIQCPDKFHISECSPKMSIVTDDDQIIAIESGKSGLNVLPIGYISVALLDVEYTNDVDIVKAECRKNKLFIKLKNAENVECVASVGDKFCRFLCMESDCEHFCPIPDVGEKLKATISCGGDKHDYWLFRTKSSKLSGLQGHGHWRSHSSIISTLLIIDIVLGYIIIRFIISLGYYLYRLLCSTFHFVNDHYSKYLFNIVSSHFDACPNCKVVPKNIYDAFLHDKFCVPPFCPYCKKDFDIDDEHHIETCLNREPAIALSRLEMKQEIKETVAQVHKNMKVNLWRNRLTRDRVPSKIWLSSLGFLVLLLLICPSSALLKKPCNKMVGQTSKCSSKDSFSGLSGEVEEHAYWSGVELGMLSTLEERFSHDTFASNSIHRVKTSALHLGGDSEETLEISGTKCRNNGVCKAVTELKWASDVYRGNIQMYRTKNPEFHDSTMNIFIGDAELVYPLTLIYRTANWKVLSEPGFACTETDCSKICTRKPGVDKCLLRKEIKEKETSWAHNPAWCLSINSGCTCVDTVLALDHDSSIYEVYKTGIPVLRGLICLEQNSLYIDCVEVEKTGTYDLGRNKIILSKWASNLMVNKKIIIEKTPGKSANKTFAKTGPVCEVENCNMGDAGDLQFTTMTTNCNDSYYFNMNGLDIKLDYDFARTPNWDVFSPRSGAFRFAKYKSLTESDNSQHVVNVEDGQLVYTDDNFGSFSMTASIMDLEIYEVKDESKISDFEVKNCMGEYMSEKGVICVFKIDLSGQDRATIKIVSDDDTAFVQGDQQAVTAGSNLFRKFMYTRSKQPSYRFCAVKKDQRLCSNFNYNLSDPSYDWSTSPYIMHTGVVNQFDSKCDYWFGLSCMVSRVIDFFRTIWSAIYWILAGVLIVIAVKIIYSILLIKWDKADPLHQDVGNTDFLKRSIAKLTNKKVRIL